MNQKRKYVKKNPEYWEKHRENMKKNSPLPKTGKRGRKPAPELFKLEKGIPVPARTRLTEVRKNIRALLSKMKANDSFVIPKGTVGTVRKVAKSDFPRKKLLTAKVTSNKDLVRVFRIK
jgi:hypothetical protein